MLLYAPACRQEDFINAIGYLVRRLDENTGPDNFLRHAFNIEVGSAEWQQLEQQFVEAFEAMRIVSSDAAANAGSESRASRGSRPASRGVRPRPSNPRLSPRPRPFRNEPDTDWSLRANGEWASSIIAAWKHAAATERDRCAARDRRRRSCDGRQVRESLDPSRPGTVVARYRQATEADIDRAVDAARRRCRRLATTLAERTRRNAASRRRRDSPPPAAT